MGDLRGSVNFHFWTFLFEINLNIKNEGKYYAKEREKKEEIRLAILCLWGVPY